MTVEELKVAIFATGSILATIALVWSIYGFIEAGKENTRTLILLNEKKGDGLYTLRKIRSILRANADKTSHAKFKNKNVFGTIAKEVEYIDAMRTKQSDIKYIVETVHDGHNTFKESWYHSLLAILVP